MGTVFEAEENLLPHAENQTSDRPVCGLVSVFYTEILHSELKKAL
jgi:hypothetical protein